MKHLSRVIVAVFMAILMATLLPVQVFADTPDYIGEIKVFFGNYADAEKEGYTILKDGNKAVDLNQNAGATGMGGKGDKAVYLGYKTTQNRNEAVTDLALMNMKGGYSVEDYEILMETQMEEQIIPFVENFTAVLEEYRANYRSDNHQNYLRAKYVCEILDKFTDDDTGATLGTLLLNETKYEMGDEAYNKLPDGEKKKHADILTILAQANGKATLLLENLLSRAADTGEDTWVDRFSAKTYDDMVDETGLSPSKAYKQLAKQYDDDANAILTMWEDLNQSLNTYDEAVKTVEEYDPAKIGDQVSDVKIQLRAAKRYGDDEKRISALAEQYAEVTAKLDMVMSCVQIVAIHDALEKTDYEDGTMLDFFMQSEEDIEDDITVLYPLVASLTDGQRAGLEFVTLRELLSAAFTTSDGYSKTSLDFMDKTSIYEGVDRTIYEKGGVALTSDSLRADALSRMMSETQDDSRVSKWSVALWAVTGACALACISSAAAWATYASKAGNALENTTGLKNALSEAAANTQEGFLEGRLSLDSMKQFNQFYETESLPASFAARSAMCKWMTVGFGIAMVILTGVSLWMTFRDLENHYKVEFTPIPHHMIDEKDLIGYNSKGEKIVLKNQSAYYKAVTCNRAESAEFYGTVGEMADLNGDVGKQWLALYAAKNDAELPILADSLKVVVNSAEIPAGYTTGIHMFGSAAAENINNTLYVWNSKAPKIYVYFKVDESATNAAGSTFTAGTLALSGSAGILLGAVVTALGMKASRKRIENRAVTV